MHVHSHDLSSLTWKLVEIFFWKKIKTLLHFHYILQGKLGLTQLTISTLSLLSKERDYRKLNKSGPRSDQTTAFILWDCLDEEIYKAAFQEELNCGEIAKKKNCSYSWSGCDLENEIPEIKLAIDKIIMRTLQYKVFLHNCLSHKWICQ